MIRLRTWLAKRLVRSGISIEVEVRHGAFRARVKRLWKGELLRAEIPVQKRDGFVDTPMGRVSMQDAKKLIDAFTGVEGEDAFQELRPGRGKFERTEVEGHPVCAACGQKLGINGKP